MSPTAKAMFFRALHEYPLEAVRAAMDAHVKDPQRGRFMPLPADLIAQIRGTAGDDGRPGAEEAWAIAVRSSDEAETVVWSVEIAEAWAIAKPIMDCADEVGARMAFKEAYLRLVGEARNQGRPVSWTASLGFDKDRRKLALDAAVQDNRLPRHEAYQLTAPTTAPLLAMGESFGAPSHVIASLRALADRLQHRFEEPSQDAQARADTLMRKGVAQAQVDMYSTPFPE